MPGADIRRAWPRPEICRFSGVKRQRSLKRLSRLVGPDCIIWKPMVGLDDVPFRQFVAAQRKVLGIGGSQCRVSRSVLLPLKRKQQNIVLIQVQSTSSQQFSFGDQVSSWAGVKRQIA